MPDQDQQSPDFHAQEIKKFARILGVAASLLALLPVLLGWLRTPEGHQYLPFHISLDDHMVYSAWIRQAMDGSFLLDNRFTTDAQPGLTINLYFFVLGLFAKLFGIPITLTLARIGFSFLAVKLLGDFLVKLGLKSFVGKFALVMACFGGGLAFLSWEMFGEVLLSGGWFTTVMQNRQPIDNWQPEAFVFPSMLTNGLFMMALCLILVTFNSVLDAKQSWKPVIPGALAFFALMNVHSYDVLLIAFVLVCFLVTLIASKQFDAKWTLRVAVIGVAALPPALWFMYVLQNDPVFQARAETLTYTGSFRQILVGLLPVFGLAVLSIFRSEIKKERRLAAGIGLIIFVSVLFAMSANYVEGYFLTQAAWVLFFVIALGIAALLATKDIGWNLLWSWALIGLIAPYFPALFQRKLLMMIVIPWAILGAIGLAKELQRMERQPRNLVAAVALAIICMSSVFWLRRDLELGKMGVSKTLAHNTTLTRDEVEIIRILNETEDRVGVLAMPGLLIKDSPPYLNDLSPVLSGLAGAYTYAGHWSETPKYNEKRSQASSFFVTAIPTETRLEILSDWGINYVVAPVPETYSALQTPLVDLSELGETVYSGQQLRLIKIR